MAAEYVFASDLVISLIQDAISHHMQSHQQVHWTAACPFEPYHQERRFYVLKTKSFGVWFRSFLDKHNIDRWRETPRSTVEEVVWRSQYTSATAATHFGSSERPELFFRASNTGRPFWHIYLVRDEDEIGLLFWSFRVRFHERRWHQLLPEHQSLTGMRMIQDMLTTVALDDIFAHYPAFAASKIYLRPDEQPHWAEFSAERPSVVLLGPEIHGDPHGPETQQPPTIIRRQSTMMLPEFSQPNTPLPPQEAPVLIGGAWNGQPANNHSRVSQSHSVPQQLPKAARNPDPYSAPQSQPQRPQHLQYALPAAQENRQEVQSAAAGVPPNWWASRENLGPAPTTPPPAYNHGIREYAAEPRRRLPNRTPTPTKQPPFPAGRPLDEGMKNLDLGPQSPRRQSPVGGVRVLPTGNPGQQKQNPSPRRLDQQQFSPPRQTNPQYQMGFPPSGNEPQHSHRSRDSGTPAQQLVQEWHHSQEFLDQKPRRQVSRRSTQATTARPQSTSPPRDAKVLYRTSQEYIGKTNVGPARQTELTSLPNGTQPNGAVPGKPKVLPLDSKNLAKIQDHHDRKYSDREKRERKERKERERRRGDSRDRGHRHSSRSHHHHRYECTKCGERR